MRPDSFAALVVAAAQAGNAERMHMLQGIAETNAKRARREGDTLGLSKWQAELEEIEAALDALRRDAA